MVAVAIFRQLKKKSIKPAYYVAFLLLRHVYGNCEHGQELGAEMPLLLANNKRPAMLTGSGSCKQTVAWMMHRNVSIWSGIKAVIVFAFAAVVVVVVVAFCSCHCCCRLWHHTATISTLLTATAFWPIFMRLAAMAWKSIDFVVEKFNGCRPQLRIMLNI